MTETDWEKLLHDLRESKFALTEARKIDSYIDAMKRIRNTPNAMSISIIDQMRKALVELTTYSDSRIRREAITTLRVKAVFFRNYETALALYKIATTDPDQTVRDAAAAAFIVFDIAIVERETDLNKAIEKMVLRFFYILRTVPRISGEIADGPGGGTERYCKEIVTVIFDHGEEVELKYDGRAYDYTILDPAKWRADSTKIQIDRLVATKGRIPTILRFKIDDNYHDNAPPNQPILEFAYSDVENILDDHCGATIDLPYRLVGGTLRIRTAI